MAEECAFKSVQHTLTEETTQQTLASLVETLNADESLHGILVQLPLPSHPNSDLIIQSILPEKDVDGLHVVNAGKLATGDLESGLVFALLTGLILMPLATTFGWGTSRCRSISASSGSISSG